ncbi:MAG: hypothetical protein M0C28_48835, partial [Candidatus Moduliflexus flocculans]|nr:hypothetical protein [Candidatus Moduliflexus flocculans]
PSGHARHDPDHARARRREDHQRRGRGRLPPPRLREDLRKQDLVQPPALHGSPQLRLAAHQQSGLCHDRGEARRRLRARAGPAASASS